MKYFRIRNFSGLENAGSGLDSDRGTLRLLSNAVPYPEGTVSNAPQWTRVYENMTPQAGKFETFNDADENGVAIMTNAVGITTNIAVIPKRGLNPTPTGLASGLQELDYPYPDAHLSRIGNTLVLGNGADTGFVNTNMLTTRIGAQWSIPTDMANAPFPVVDYYARRYEPFPNCRMFILGPDKSVYAAGNAENPLTVYVSEPSDVLSGGLAGLVSGVMNSTTLLASGATTITALSTHKNSVVCHTDAGVYLLQKTEDMQAPTGYRVGQASSPTNAGAASPQTVSPSLGTAPYYLGTDGQIYRNAVEPALDDQLQPRRNSIASWKAVGGWDANIKDLTGAFTTYDTQGNWLLVGANSDGRDQSNGHAWYLLSGDKETISGPHWYPRFTCVQAIPGSSSLLGVDGDGQFWATDLNDIRERRDLLDDFVNDATGGPSVTVVESRDTGNIIGTDTGLALATENTHMFLLNEPFQAEFIPDDTGLLNLHWPSPTADRNDAAAELVGTNYPNTVMAVIETAFEDFQKPEATKHFMELVLKFDGGSVGHMGVFVETEDGLVDGSWLGNIELKDSHKLFVNIRGRKLRVRVYVAAELDTRWVLNDITVGYNELHTL